VDDRRRRKFQARADVMARQFDAYELYTDIV
jgi:hypothetical protein